MPPASDQILSITIIVSTLLLAALGAVIVWYIFLYQRKRFRHSQEVLELREAFNQTLLESKLEIQEQTLDHISKELHANFSHLVSLININLSVILPQASDEMKEGIVETKSLAIQLLAELKALSASLNTDHIMHIGFAKALDNELTRIGNTRQFHISILKEGQSFTLSPEKEIILFRLCQEVLNNALRYSKAKTIQATLDYTPGRLTVILTDDGIGFNPQQALHNRGENTSTGLTNIIKRARLIEASVDIKSQPGQGTAVTIAIPHKILTPSNL